MAQKDRDKALHCESLVYYQCSFLKTITYTFGCQACQRCMQSNTNPSTLALASTMKLRIKALNGASNALRIDISPSATILELQHAVTAGLQDGLGWQFEGTMQLSLNKKVRLLSTHSGRLHAQACSAGVCSAQPVLVYPVTCIAVATLS